ncbi:bifunctional diaminohydroxyphosphoribosylaminopyrimidine deaminase/5-amino-6-(5-phosphoribosylamino)uracil reductase RibD [Caldithrix abyssi]
MPQMFSQFDKKMMRRCFTLARKGRFKVRPNPMVGAVLVKNGRVIGEGYHRYFGGPHAEVEAFQNATEDPTGATLYCNLEPCCHANKKTPPCTPLVISKKVARVVVANIDPNPDVSGKGLQQMREAGIQVESGLLQEEGAELNRVFFLNMKENRPFITLKIARSLDGFISESRDKQTWLTSEKAIKFVHRLRAEHQAVLVGAGTVRADDPQLTVRMARGPQPLRLALSASLIFSDRAQIFTDRFRDKTLIITTQQADKEKIEQLLGKGVRVESAPDLANGNVNLRWLLETLWQKFKIGSLLVEGGQQIFTNFLNERLLDELILIETPVLLGQGLPAFDRLCGHFLQLKTIKKLGPDVAIIYRKKER